MRYVLPLAALAITACNTTPVADLEKSFTLAVEAKQGGADGVKIDFLWVVDNSTSMCEEQRALGVNFETFRSSLETNFTVDARIAVTTVDAQCDNNGTTVFAAKGKFNQHVNHTAPFACTQTVRKYCANDDDCAGLDCSELGQCDSDGTWKCARPNIDQCIENPNGSFNSACRRTCTSDTECQQLFGNPAYRCLTPQGNSGCVLPPPTDGCPDEMPVYLEKNAQVDNTDLFRCIANVGVEQANCLRYEQPLRTAYMALDPTGANADQAASFLRPDAYLVVIVVSDEEDCSVADGRDNVIQETAAFRCGLFDTTDNGGPLVPAGHFVNRFKSLKSDPSKVIVATIAGDSLATNPADKDAEREAYIASKSAPRDCNASTYICDSAEGVADYGARYHEFADSFGPNGTFQNICDEGGMEKALLAIADTIIAVVNRLCLPKKVLAGLEVSRTRNGETTVLTQGHGEGTFDIIPAAEDCAVDGELMPALIFGDPPKPGDQIQVNYQGDPELD